MPDCLSETFTARPAGPYIHADERGVVFCDGQHTVIAHGNHALTFLAQTLGVLERDGRATRRLHELACGGFINPDGDLYTLYVSDVRASLSLIVERDALTALLAALPDAGLPD